MTEQTKYRNAMRGLIEATYSVSDLVHVPVETLIIAMLAVVKPEDADTLLEAAKFFAPLRQPPAKAKPEVGAPGLMASSPRFKHMLTLIERDNPALFKKLTGLD